MHVFSDPRALGRFGLKSDIDCSKPSAFSRIFILERANRIARELDASTKLKTCLGRGEGPRKIALFGDHARFALTLLIFTSACVHREAVNIRIK